MIEGQTHEVYLWNHGQGLNGLQTALALELHPDDQARIYPVCARCQRGARIHGEGQLESPPVAYIY